MSKILKNTTASIVSIDDVGQSVPASGQLTILPIDDLLYRNSSDTVTLVGNETLIVSDGTDDLEISDGIDLIKGLFQNKINLVDETGASIGSFTGPQGPQGDIGPQGDVGPMGATGPTELVAKDTLVTTITLPNTNSFAQVRDFAFNLAQSGDYVASGVMAVRPHSPSNDMIFEWDLDGVTLQPNDTYREEHKDSSSNESMLRPIQFDLGNLAAGAHSFETYFRKESTGGTAQIKYISLFIWRVS